MMENEDIKMTWQKENVEMCIKSADFFIISSNKNLECKRKIIGYEQLDYEILNTKPVILKLSKFLNSKSMKNIENYFEKSGQIEEQGVEGYAYSNGYRGRRANGVWIESNKPIIRPLYNRIRTILRLNPAIAEDFLVLKYNELGHYAIHYDHLDEMSPDEDDGWFKFYGNRLATALLLLKVADRGGATIFPHLNLTIQPEMGDLILWFNADSNDKRELKALHAACPIEMGEKMAVSLWIRGNFQHHLKCSIKHAGYEAEEILRENFKEIDDNFPKDLLERPKIPNWIFD